MWGVNAPGTDLAGNLSVGDTDFTGNQKVVWGKADGINITNSVFPEDSTSLYSRLAMIGADAAFPIGATVVRLESAYFPNRKMQAKSETIISGGENGTGQHEVMALAGLDWMPSGWTITAQYYCDVVLNKSDNLERKEAFNHGATLSISKSFLQVVFFMIRRRDSLIFSWDLCYISLSIQTGIEWLPRI